MGELCGTLTYYVSQYVNQNIHRYTPGKALEREYERMREPLVECLLQVAGDPAAPNTFDKQFRSGTGPQWSVRPFDGTPRYSLHALFPVPEDIQRRGYRRPGICGVRSIGRHRMT